MALNLDSRQERAITAAATAIANGTADVPHKDLLALRDNFIGARDYLIGMAEQFVTKEDMSVQQAVDIVCVDGALEGDDLQADLGLR